MPYKLKLPSLWLRPLLLPPVSLPPSQGEQRVRAASLCTGTMVTAPTPETKRPQKPGPRRCWPSTGNHDFVRDAIGLATRAWSRSDGCSLANRPPRTRCRACQRGGDG